MTSRLVRVTPNILSAMRLALAACFWALPDDWRLPAVIAGGLSDWLDGMIARRYRATTTTGQLLDAAADKLFTLSVILTLCFDSTIEWWQAPVVLCRDLIVAAMVAYAFLARQPDQVKQMRPRLPGKLTTSAVFIWFVVVLFGAPAALLWTLFTIAGGLSTAAGLDYLHQFINRPRSK